MSQLALFEQLRNKLDIVNIVGQKLALKRKGKEFLGICPFHSEKTPSFTVNPVKQFYHCFGCGEHGDVIKFVATQSALTYSEAAIKLAQENGIAIPKYSKEEQDEEKEQELIYHINKLATDFFQQSLNIETFQYLGNRGIDKDGIKNFGIGYAPKVGLQKFLESNKIALVNINKAGLMAKGESGFYEVFRNRIIFPIYNIYSKIIGFGGRSIGEVQPKYLNSPETLVFKKNESFYGENKAISASYKAGNIILVEGYMDVIAMHKHGFENTLASLGTAVTEKHIQKLWRYTDEIILCLDGDEAGKKATKRTIELALPIITENKMISAIKLPLGMDPDDAINKFGKNFIENLLNNKKMLSQIIWELETDSRNFPTPESKSQLEQKLSKYCEFLKDNVLRKHYFSFFREKIWQLSRNKNTTSTNIHNNMDMLNSLKIDEGEQIGYNLMAVLCKHTSLLEDKRLINELEKVDFKQQPLIDFKIWLMLLIKEQVAFDKALKNFVNDNSVLSCYNQIMQKQNIDNINEDESVNPRDLWLFFYTSYEFVTLKNNYEKMLKIKKSKMDENEIKSYSIKLNILHQKMQDLN